MLMGGYFEHRKTYFKRKFPKFMPPKIVEVFVFEVLAIACAKLA